MTRSIDEAIVDPVTYARPDVCDALFTQLRRDTPVRWTQPAGYRPFWTVSKYSDIMEVEGQNERFINAPRLTLNTIETEERTRAKTGGNARPGDLRRTQPLRDPRPGDPGVLPLLRRTLRRAAPQSHGRPGDRDRQRADQRPADRDLRTDVLLHDHRRGGSRHHERHGLRRPARPDPEPPRAGPAARAPRPDRPRGRGNAALGHAREALRAHRPRGLPPAGP